MEFGENQQKLKTSRIRFTCSSLIYENYSSALTRTNNFQN